MFANMSAHMSIHMSTCMSIQMDDAALSKHSHVPTAGEKTVPFNERMLVPYK